MTDDAKPDTWMPLVIGDYKKDTGRLTRDLHGGYLLLIMEYWTTGPLANDDADLAAIVLASPREWKTIRPKLERFFTVVDGVWRHKRIDAELERWAKKKEIYAARAAAGGRAKAAKSTASSTPKALLNGCLKAAPQPASTVVGALTGQPTHSGQNDFLGPKDVRQAFVDARGEDWTASYIDPCGWQDVPDRALIPRTQVAGRKILGEARAVLAKLGLTLLERAA